MKIQLKKPKLYRNQFDNPEYFREQIRINNDALNEFTVRIATEKKELEAAYNLVYKAYLKEGYIDTNESQLYYSFQQAHPLATTFIGLYQNEVVITISILPDSILGLPMDQLFKKELDYLRENRRRIAEVSSFASDEKYRDGSQQFPLLMSNAISRYAKKYLGIEDLLIAVNPKHQLHYQNVLLFSRIAESKNYPRVNDHVAVPLQLDLNTCEKKYYKIYGSKPRNQDLYHFFFVKTLANVIFPKGEDPQITYNQELYEYFFTKQDGYDKAIDKQTHNNILDLYRNFFKSEPKKKYAI